MTLFQYHIVIPSSNDTDYLCVVHNGISPTYSTSIAKNELKSYLLSQRDPLILASNYIPSFIDIDHYKLNLPKKLIPGTLSSEESILLKQLDFKSLVLPPASLSLVPNSQKDPFSLLKTNEIIFLTKYNVKPIIIKQSMEAMFVSNSDLNSENSKLNDCLILTNFKEYDYMTGKEIIYVNNFMDIMNLYLGENFISSKFVYEPKMESFYKENAIISKDLLEDLRAQLLRCDIELTWHPNFSNFDLVDKRNSKDILPKRLVLNNNELTAEEDDETIIYRGNKESVTNTLSNEVKSSKTKDLLSNLNSSIYNKTTDILKKRSWTEILNVFYPPDNKELSNRVDPTTKGSKLIPLLSRDKILELILKVLTNHGGFLRIKEILKAMRLLGYSVGYDLVAKVIWSDMKDYVFVHRTTKIVYLIDYLNENQDKLIKNYEVVTNSSMKTSNVYFDNQDDEYRGF